MRYYKWMFEDQDRVRRVPGFVFVSIEDAAEYTDDFDDWCHNPGKSKKLFTFEGVEPTTIKQILTSHFGQRTPPYQTQDLTDAEVERVLDYFETKQVDYFCMAAGDAEIPLMLSVAKAVGCIKHAGPPRKYVAGVEALYMWPVEMVQVSPEELMALGVQD